MDFLGGSEIVLKKEMINLSNSVQQAELQAKKVENKNKTENMKQLEQVTREFESIFLSYMLNQMRKTVPEDPIFGNSIAKDIFYDMYNDAISRELSKAGGIGLASILYNQMAKIEEAKINDTSK
ncbi:MAG: rod-binding protein [Candidatus Goldbacteria bacterium]|nr:rod-binding protein [Candidatus Goldiibacteriota bacterium]